MTTAYDAARIAGMDDDMAVLYAEAVAAREAETCRHCGRTIVPYDGGWIDPEASGDDEVWRETCDSHDTFTAEHEPDE